MTPAIRVYIKNGQDIDAAADEMGISIDKLKETLLGQGATSDGLRPSQSRRAVTGLICIRCGIFISDPPYGISQNAKCNQITLEAFCPGCATFIENGFEPTYQSLHIYA